MRVMFSEYGLATIYVIVAVFAFFMWDLFLSEQKGYGVVMDAVVASISGTNIDDVTNAKNEIKARGWEYAE